MSKINYVERFATCPGCKGRVVISTAGQLRAHGCPQSCVSECPYSLHIMPLPGEENPPKCRCYGCVPRETE